MTNLDEINTGYIDKPEATMEILSEDGATFSVEALLDPGSYSTQGKSSLSKDNRVNIVSYISEQAANAIATKIKRSRWTTCPR